MKFIFILALVLSGLSAQALELEYLNQVVLPHKLKFKKSTIGGLSGLTFDSTTGVLSAISDDRGNINEPRIYQFKVTAGLKEFKLDPEQVVFLSVNESELSHKSTKSKAKLFSKVLDLEGIAMAPWGDFLVVNEGDMNKKPRVPPQLLDIKADGTIVREFELPSDFLPEPTGEQKKGVQNNLALEGLAANPNGKEWIVSAEAPLKQDPKTFVRFISYSMPEAWVLKPQKEFHYPFVTATSDPKALMEFQKGISDIQFVDESQLLVMERAARLTSEGLQFSVQLYETDLKGADKQQPLPRKLVLDFDSISAKIGKIENFEGIAIGPRLSNGRRSLILVSDDNFVREQRTQFLLFAIKE